MVFPSSPSGILITAAVVAFIGWRLYSRFRRLVGRQTLRPRRSWFSIVFFSALLLLLLAASVVHPLNAAALAAGAVLGTGLGILGNRLTRFEVTPAGLFYTPNAHLGIALSLLFVGRLAYRAVLLYSASGTLGMPAEHVTRSPLTLAIFGTLAGYYVSYAIGLLRWRGRVERERLGTPAASA